MSMPQKTKIEGAKFIVTVDETRRIIRDGTIVVQGDRIEQIGKASERKTHARATILAPSVGVRDWRIST